MTVGISYTRTFPFAERTKAIGEQVRQELDGISSAVTLVDTIMTRAIRLPAGFDGTLPTAVESRANQVIGFDNAGNLQIQPGVGRDRGNWVTGADYKVRDIFKDAAGIVGLNNLYIVNTAHTSTTLPVDAANYDLLISVAEVEAAKVAAANSASAAATSETNAAGSAGSAATSATNSANSATNSANSASASQTSATNSANSATASANSATLAANLYDNFDDRYLGAKSANPALDNDGNALLTGAEYFNTTVNEKRVYTGAQWIAASNIELATETVAGKVEKATTAEAQAGTANKYPDAAAIKVERDKRLEKTANLSDVASAVTAFTNIKQAATEVATGVVEKATLAELQAGTADKYPDAIVIRNNILGTVSQSAGVPTGAIIESGSNANGEYVRYAGGALICNHVLVSSSSGEVTWTYPSVFSTAPHPSGTPTTADTDTNIRAFRTANIGTGSFTFSVNTSSNTRGVVSTRLTAIGRWF